MARTINIDTSNKAALQASLTTEFETLEKNYSEVLEKLGAAQGDRDELKNGLKDLKKVLDDAMRTRFAVDKTGNIRALPKSVTKEQVVQFGMKALHAAEAKDRVKMVSLPYGNRFEIDEDDVLANFQRASDDVHLVRLMMGVKNWHEIPNLKVFRDRFLPAAREGATLVKEAFDIQTAGEGLEWLATDMSEQFIEMIRMQRVVAALFEEVPMRHGTLKFPTWLVDLSAKKFAENTSDSGGTAIHEGLNTRNVTSNFSLAAVAAGVTITMSKFVEEDSAIDMLPWGRGAMTEALKEGEEDWIINGDLTGTHMDADVAALDMATMGYGLRYVGNQSVNPARVSAGASKLDSDAAIVATLLASMGGMGKYGVDPSKVALIVGANGNAQLLGVPMWLTANVVGRATNTTGQVGFTPFGWRYAVSSKVKNSLAATGVNTSGTSAVDKTCSILANTRTWKLGRVREITLQVLVETRAKYDQNEIVATMREAFGTPYLTDGTEPHVGYIYDQGV